MSPLSRSLDSRQSPCYPVSVVPFETVLYCPECGVQYEPGTPECLDCLIPLVSERPRRTREHVTVLESRDFSQIAAAAQYLEELGIACWVWPAGAGDAPARERRSISPACGLEVLVDREQEAIALLEAVDLNALARQSNSPRPRPDPVLAIVTICECKGMHDLALVKAALGNAGIAFHVHGGLGDYALGQPSGPFKIQVASDRLSEALAAIEPFEAHDPDSGE